MMIRLTDILPNPLRDFNLDPMDQAKIDALRASIQDLSFWGGICVRKLPTVLDIPSAQSAHWHTAQGCYELAYGHHRLAALVQAGAEGVKADINIVDYDDEKMAKAMGLENATQRKGLAALTDAIGAAIKVLGYKLLKSKETDEAFIPKIGETPHEDVAKARGRLLAGSGLGVPVIRAFFNNVISDGDVTAAIASLKQSGKMQEYLAEVQARIAEEHQEAEAKRQEAEREAREAAERAARDKELAEKLAAELAAQAEEAARLEEETERLRQEEEEAAQDARDEEETIKFLAEMKAKQDAAAAATAAKQAKQAEVAAAKKQAQASSKTHTAKKKTADAAGKEAAKLAKTAKDAEQAVANVAEKQPQLIDPRIASLFADYGTSVYDQVRKVLTGEAGRETILLEDQYKVCQEALEYMHKERERWTKPDGETLIGGSVFPFEVTARNISVVLHGYMNAGRKFINSVIPDKEKQDESIMAAANDVLAAIKKINNRMPVLTQCLAEGKRFPYLGVSVTTEDFFARVVPNVITTLQNALDAYNDRVKLISVQ